MTDNLIKSINDCVDIYSCNICKREYSDEEKAKRCEEKCNSIVSKGEGVLNKIKRFYEIKKRKKIFANSSAVVEYAITGDLTELTKINDVLRDFHYKQGKKFLTFMEKEGFLLNLLENPTLIENLPINKGLPPKDKKLLILEFLSPVYKTGSEVLNEMENLENHSNEYKNLIHERQDTLNFYSGKLKQLALVYYYFNVGKLNKFTYFHQARVRLSKIDFIIEKLEEYRNVLNSLFKEKGIKAHFDYLAKLFPKDYEGKKIASEDMKIIKKSFSYEKFPLSDFFPEEEPSFLYKELLPKEPVIVLGGSVDDEMVLVPPST